MINITEMYYVSTLQLCFFPTVHLHYSDSIEAVISSQWNPKSKRDTKKHVKLTSSSLGNYIPHYSN